MDQQEPNPAPEGKRGPGRPPKTQTVEVIASGQGDAPADLVAPRDAAPLNLSDDIERIRALRDANPFGTFDNKLAYPPIEGYKQHWFNDKPGRIEAAMRAGWAYVNGPDGKPKAMVVDGGGLKAFLLKIPEQFWAEDQARQQAKAQAALDAVKKKPDQVAGAQVKPSDRGNFYTPEGRPDAATISRS